MTTRSIAVLIAGAVALAGAAFAAPASAAPLPPVSAVPALAQDAAAPVLGAGEAQLDKVHYYRRYYGPRHGYYHRPYYGPRYGYYGHRPYYGPRYGYYGGPRCRVTRVYTGYGYRTVRRCW